MHEQFNSINVICKAYDKASIRLFIYCANFIYNVQCCYQHCQYRPFHFGNGVGSVFFFFFGYPHLFVNISYLPYFLFENIRQYVTD